MDTQEAIDRLENLRGQVTYENDGVALDMAIAALTGSGGARFNVRTLTKTCGACPAQWEGETFDGKRVYARYRWGHLSVSVDNETVFSEQLGDGYDGTLSLESLRVATLKHFNWPVSDGE
jgi:hypothetical protein